MPPYKGIADVHAWQWCVWIPCCVQGGADSHTLWQLCGGLIAVYVLNNCLGSIVLYLYLYPFSILLTHWGRVTHICVGNLTIIGSDNGLSPGRCQAIIWTNAGIILIGSLGTNLSEILIEILTFSFKKMCLKLSSAKWRPFCLGLNLST